MGEIKFNYVHFYLGCHHQDNRNEKKVFGSSSFLGRIHVWNLYCWLLPYFLDLECGLRSKTYHELFTSSIHALQMQIS